MLVKEITCTGFIGRWFHQRGWGAVTLPSFRGITIRYWVVRSLEVAAHERGIHVPQIRKMGRLRYLWTYAREWLRGYRFYRVMGFPRGEAAAYAYDAHAMERDDWADHVR